MPMLIYVVILIVAFLVIMIGIDLLQNLISLI